MFKTEITTYNPQNVDRQYSVNIYKARSGVVYSTRVWATSYKGAEELGTTKLESRSRMGEGVNASSVKVRRGDYVEVTQNVDDVQRLDGVTHYDKKTKKRYQVYSTGLSRFYLDPKTKERVNATPSLQKQVKKNGGVPFPTDMTGATYGKAFEAAQVGKEVNKDLLQAIAEAKTADKAEEKAAELGKAHLTLVEQFSELETEELERYLLAAEVALEARYHQMGLLCGGVSLGEFADAIKGLNGETYWSEPAAPSRWTRFKNYVAGVLSINIFNR